MAKQVKERLNEHELAVLNKWGRTQIITCPICKGAGLVIEKHGKLHDKLCDECNGERFIAVITIEKNWSFSIHDSRFNIRDSERYNDERLAE